MKTLYEKRFLKDMASLPASCRERIEKLVFNTIPDDDHKGLMSRVQRLKGRHGFYKIRVGEYRIGLRLLNGAVNRGFTDEGANIYSRLHR